MVWNPPDFRAGGEPLQSPPCTPNRFRRRLGLLLACLIPAFPAAAPAGERPPAAAVATAGGDFELDDARGGRFRLSAQRGKAVLIYFGYTGCPDACPTELLVFRDLLAQLGPRARRLVPVFISVDPARDAPRQLADYAAAFSPRIVPLSGKESGLRKVARAYGAHFRYVDRKPGSANYGVDHTTSLFLVDPQGKLVGVIPFGTPPAEVRRRVEAVLGPD